MTVDRTVLIAGGGASGALVAANVLRNAPGTRVVLIEPRAELARGMAYSTTCPRHLLNVPAAKMSAFPEDAGHFVRWLQNSGLAGYSGMSFVPRMIYGDYLSAVLDEARAGASSRDFVHAQTKAVELKCSNGKAQVRLANRTSVTGDALVLALGNQAPARWPNLSPDVQESGRYFAVAWANEALNPPDREIPVLLLGTGLTSVDAVLALRNNGHRGPVYMTSRRGLVPAAHLPSDCKSEPFSGSATACEVARNMRLAAIDSEILYGNWRVAVDGIRPTTNELWQMLPFDEQKRFLRHLRAYWDVHRHRMAPEIASTIGTLIADGTLRICAGRIGTMQLTPSGISVPINRRGSTRAEQLEVGRVINCTGPEANLNRITDPIIESMLQQGYLTPHPLRTGALVDNDGALIGADGESSTALFAMGPLRWGTLLETVAIPEIRDQASQLSNLLTKSRMPDPASELVGAR